MTTTSTSATTTTATTTATTTTTIGNDMCKNGDGLYPDYESKCEKFYMCSNSLTSSVKVTFYNCPSGLLFDTSIMACNVASQVPCVDPSKRKLH